MTIILQLYNYDVNKLTLPQMELYSKAIDQREREKDLRSQKKQFMLIKLAMAGKEDYVREYLKNIDEALHDVETERKKRFGYEFEGRIREEEV